MGPLGPCGPLNMNFSGGGRGEEKSFNSRCVWKVRPTGCANKLDRGMRERSQG